VPWNTHNTSIRDESADGSQIRINVMHQLVHRLGIRGINLVSLCLDIELFRNLLGYFRGFFVLVVDDGDVASCLRDLSRDGQSDASVATGDDDRLAALE
jgi:hypothetical protein